jgi:hypothetical protein
MSMSSGTSGIPSRKAITSITATGDHFPGGFSISGPFLCDGRGAYGVWDGAITLVLRDLATLVP